MKAAAEKLPAPTIKNDDGSQQLGIIEGLDLELAFRQEMELVAKSVGHMPAMEVNYWRSRYADWLDKKFDRKTQWEAKKAYERVWPMLWERISGIQEDTGKNGDAPVINNDTVFYGWKSGNKERSQLYIYDHGSGNWGVTENIAEATPFPNFETCIEHYFTKHAYPADWVNHPYNGKLQYFNGVGFPLETPTRKQHIINSLGSRWEFEEADNPENQKLFPFFIFNNFCTRQKRERPNDNDDWIAPDDTDYIQLPVLRCDYCGFPVSEPNGPGYYTGYIVWESAEVLKMACCKKYMPKGCIEYKYQVTGYREPIIFPDQFKESLPHQMVWMLCFDHSRKYTARGYKKIDLKTYQKEFAPYNEAGGSTFKDGWLYYDKKGIYWHSGSYLSPREIKTKAKVALTHAKVVPLINEILAAQPENSDITPPKEPVTAMASTAKAAGKSGKTPNTKPETETTDLPPAETPVPEQNAPELTPEEMPVLEDQALTIEGITLNRYPVFFKGWSGFIALLSPFEGYRIDTNGSTRATIELENYSCDGQWLCCMFHPLADDLRAEWIGPCGKPTVKREEAAKRKDLTEFLRTHEELTAEQWLKEVADKFQDVGVYNLVQHLFQQNPTNEAPENRVNENNQGLSPVHSNLSAFADQEAVSQSDWIAGMSKNLRGAPTTTKTADTPVPPHLPVPDLQLPTSNIQHRDWKRGFKVKGIDSYNGGKGAAGVYQKLINIIPPHDIYVAGCLGHDAIIRHKRPAAINIGIEMDQKIVELWQKMGLPWLELRNQSILDWLNSSQITRLSRNSFINLDPPYRKEDRKSTADLYLFEWKEDQHLEMLQLVNRLKCNVMISAYQNSVYDQYLKDWHVFEYEGRTRQGNVDEVAYCNYDYTKIKKLHDYHFLGEDYRERERITQRMKLMEGKLKKLPALERNALIAMINEKF